MRPWHSRGVEAPPPTQAGAHLDVLFRDIRSRGFHLDLDALIVAELARLQEELERDVIEQAHALSRCRSPLTVFVADYDDQLVAPAEGPLRALELDVDQLG